MILAFAGAGLLDVAGPAEVFVVADQIVGGDAYRVRIVSPDGADVVSSSGFRIGVESSAAEVGGPVDTMIVPGTWTWPEAVGRRDLLTAVRDAAARSRRVVSVCVGAFVLAEAGLLDGRRATTHWQFFDELAEAIVKSFSGLGNPLAESCASLSSTGLNPVSTNAR